MGIEDRKPLVFSSFYCLLFPFHNRKSMFAVWHSDISSLKSGLLHFTGQPCCKKSTSARVKDGIINQILRNYLVDQYSRTFWSKGPIIKLKEASIIASIIFWIRKAKYITVLNKEIWIDIILWRQLQNNVTWITIMPAVNHGNIFL